MCLVQFPATRANAVCLLEMRAPGIPADHGSAHDDRQKQFSHVHINIRKGDGGLSGWETDLHAGRAADRDLIDVLHPGCDVGVVCRDSATAAFEEYSIACVVADDGGEEPQVCLREPLNQDIKFRFE